MARFGRLVSALVLSILLAGNRVLVSSLLHDDQDGGFSVAISESAVSVVTCPMEALISADARLKVLCTNDNYLGSACLFACDVGWAVSGNSVTVCEDQGRWSDEIPTCESTDQVWCQPSLSEPDQGWMKCSNDGNHIGTTCQFGCDNDLKLIGGDLLSCQEDGLWSSNQPVCIDPESACDALVDLPHGYVSCSMENAPGSVCDFFCDGGYAVSGPLRLVCGEDAAWSSSPPQCLPVTGVDSCEPAHADPDNGHVDCTNSNSIDSICSFRCEDGFGTVGSPYSVCQADGKWSEEAPQCLEMRCTAEKERQLKGGRMMCTSGNSIGSLCRFTCEQGAVLSGSEYSKCVGDAVSRSAKWNTPVPTCLPDLDRKPAKRRSAPYWLVCLLRNNQEACLARFLLYCLMSGTKCL